MTLLIILRKSTETLRLEHHIWQYDRSLIERKVGMKCFFYIDTYKGLPKRTKLIFFYA